MGEVGGRGRRERKEGEGRGITNTLGDTSLVMCTALRMKHGC